MEGGALDLSSLWQRASAAASCGGVVGRDEEDLGDGDGDDDCIRQRKKAPNLDHGGSEVQLRQIQSMEFGDTTCNGDRSINAEGSRWRSRRRLAVVSSELTRRRPKKRHKRGRLSY